LGKIERANFTVVIKKTFLIDRQMGWAWSIQGRQLKQPSLLDVSLTICMKTLIIWVKFTAPKPQVQNFLSCKYVLHRRTDRLGLQYKMQLRQ
jgi:hypothetical protein